MLTNSVLSAVSVKLSVILVCVYLMQDEAAFYVMDLDRLLQLHQDWVEAMPSVKPYFSMKTNPDPILLKTLAALGAGFDCGNRVHLDLLDLYL